MAIINIPTFVDPANPTPTEQAAQDLFIAQMETIRRLISPDITAPITDTELPDAVISDPGYLVACQRQVLTNAGYTEATVMALPPDSLELAILVYATQLLIATKLISQAAQIIQESVLSESARLQEIDWKERLAELRLDYKDQILTLNPGATVSITVDPVQVFVTSSNRY